MLVDRRRRRLRGRQGRGRIDAAGHERPLAADRPDRDASSQQHPLVGVGLGSQPRRARRSRRTAARRRSSSPTRRRSRSRPSSASIGLALYAALLAGVGEALLRVYRLEAAFGLALAAVFLALFVHSLFYSGFFEDPLTWLVLGVASSFLASQTVTPRRDPAVSGARIDRRAAFGVLGVLGALVAVERAVARLRSVAVPHRRRSPRSGLLAPSSAPPTASWDLGVVRTPAVLAGVLVAALAIAGWRAQSWRPRRARRRLRGGDRARHGARDAPPGRACATDRRRGSTRTTRRTRSSSPASSSATATPRTATTTTAPGSSGSTAATAAVPPPTDAPAGGADAFRVLPGHGVDRGRVELRPLAASTTTACSSCSRRSAASSPCSSSTRRCPGASSSEPRVAASPLLVRGRLVRDRGRDRASSRSCSPSRC